MVPGVPSDLLSSFFTFLAWRPAARGGVRTGIFTPLKDQKNKQRVWVYLDTHTARSTSEVGFLSRGAERHSGHTHRSQSHQAAMAHGHRRRLALDGVLEHRQELGVALAAIELARE